jgi:hypothetical protein
MQWLYLMAAEEGVNSSADLLTDSRMVSTLCVPPNPIVIVLTRIFHELLSRDREDGRACPPCEQGEAGGPPGNRRVLVSAPERYVAG